MEKATEQFKNRVRKVYTRASKAAATIDAETEIIMKAKKGNILARNLLFEKQLPALIDMANSGKYQHFKGNAEELISAAMLAIDRAIDLFEPSRGIRFWTFLRCHVFSAMNKECYEDRLIHLPENIVKANECDKYVRLESGHATVKDGGSLTLFETLEGEAAEEVVNYSAAKEYKGIADNLYTVLDTEEKDIIDKCYMRDEADSEGKLSGHTWSFASIAGVTGSSKDYIRNKHKQALSKLRKKYCEESDWCYDQSVS